MKMRNITRRAGAVMLMLALLLTLCPAGLAAEREVRIGSAEELVKFAEKCASDSYSSELTAILTDDIELDGTAVYIPIFLGTFDGNGHTIRHLELMSGESRLALFGRLERGGTVKNLRVEGTITPSGSQSTVGGIVAENYGRIDTCVFAGTVIASEQVGGIAALNEAGGIITACRVAGVIQGKRYTGGIVGKSAGDVVRCTNLAAVNTSVTDEELDIEELGNLDSTVYDLLKNRSLDNETGTLTDTGGIAGHSTGVLQSCENNGSVGYPHVGYNVGGIAGRQSGYISNCKNRGNIQGRKDVGGLIGQMAPDITLQASGDSLEELQDELNTLHSMLNRTMDDAQTVSDDVSAQLSQVTNYTDSARTHAGDLVDRVQEFTDANIEAVNDVSLLAERYVAKGSVVLDDLADASSAMADAMHEMEDIPALMQDVTELNDTLLAQLRDFADKTQAAAEAMQRGAEAMDKAFGVIAGWNPDLPDTSQLQDDLQTLIDAAQDLSDIASQALDEYEQTGTVSAETREALRLALQQTLEANSAVLDDLNELLKNTDFDGLLDEALEVLREFSGYMRDAMNEFSDAARLLSGAMDDLSDALDTMRELNSYFGEISEDIANAAPMLTRAADSLAQAFRDGAQWARDLGSEEPITFTPLGTDFSDSADALNAALGSVSSELGGLNDTLDTSNSVLLSDMRQINNQANKVMNLFFNILNDTQNADYTDIYEDVSDQSLQSAVEGKVQESTNSGSVSADRNVGGLVGAMAIEYDLDPEDDLTSDKTSGLRRYTYQTRAVLLNCTNTGTVEAKRSCAGSVTGRMDLGTISGCGGFGDVTSESGDYVGGVCGFSLSSIQDSYAKCTLSGGKYVGGIAGSGSRVSNCVSMVALADCDQFTGAIAGEITDDYQNNRFVSDTLAGVDRVSLSGKAEKIGYSQMLRIEGIPKQMKTLTLRFVADDVTLASYPIEYGASFPMGSAPEIPQQEGKYAVWDHETLDDLHFDTVVTAVYTTYVTTLDSPAQREDGRQVFLSEGLFDSAAQLTAEQIRLPEGELPRLSEDFWTAVRQALGARTVRYGAVLEQWQVTIPDDGQMEHLVHYLPPEDGRGELVVYVKDADGWTMHECGDFGSYATLTLPAGQTQIVLARLRAVWWVWLIPAGAALLVLVCILLAVHKKHKKVKAQAKGKQAPVET